MRSEEYSLFFIGICCSGDDDDDVQNNSNDAKHKNKLAK